MPLTTGASRRLLSATALEDTIKHPNTISRHRCRQEGQKSPDTINRHLPVSSPRSLQLEARFECSTPPPPPRLTRRCHQYCKKARLTSGSSFLAGCSSFLHATRRTTHGASSLVHVYPGRRKPDVLRPGTVGMRRSMVIRVRPCMA